MINNHTLFSTDKNYDFKKEVKGFYNSQLLKAIMYFIVILFTKSLIVIVTITLINAIVSFYWYNKSLLTMIVEIYIEDKVVTIKYLDRTNTLHKISTKIHDLDIRIGRAFTIFDSGYMKLRGEDIYLNQYVCQNIGIKKIIKVVEEYNKIKKRLTQN